MSSADLRYPHPTIMADYARAGIGVLLCGAPLLLLEVNYWLAALLGAGFRSSRCFSCARRFDIALAMCWGPTRSAPTAPPARWSNGPASTG